MPSIRFSINISAGRLEAYYRGTANQIQVLSEDGRQVRFPAAELRQFVTDSGVQGRFEISFDHNHKLQGLRRVD